MLLGAQNQWTTIIAGLANASICNARGIPEATGLVICSSQRFTKLPSYLGGFPNQEVRRKLGSPSAIPMLVASLGPSHFFPCHTCHRHRELSSSLARQHCFLKMSILTGIRQVRLAILLMVIASTAFGMSSLLRVSKLLRSTRMSMTPKKGQATPRRKKGHIQQQNLFRHVRGV